MYGLLSFVNRTEDKPRPVSACCSIVKCYCSCELHLLKPVHRSQKNVPKALKRYSENIILYFLVF